MRPSSRSHLASDTPESSGAHVPDTPQAQHPALVVHRAVRLADRLRGLIGSPAPAPGHALLISPCAAVHTAFMRYPIDVVFVDARGTVRKLVPALAPWRSATCLAARHTLELAAGEATRLGLVPGARIAPSVLFCGKERCT